MCLADYLLGEATDVGEHEISVGATSAVLVASPNPRRTLLIISPPAANTIWLSSRSGLTVGQGLHISSLDPTLTLFLARHGQMIRKGLYGLSDTGTNTITVFEGFLDFERYRHLMREYAQG